MIEAERSPVLVRGVGDVGSAVAAVLFRAGYTVALHDEPAPAAPRRGMAFTDAVFDGAAILEGLAELHDVFDAREMVPVTVVQIDADPHQQRRADEGWGQRLAEQRERKSRAG